jgi:hypothetical protein
VGPIVLLPEHVADFVLHVQQPLEVSSRPHQDPVPGLVLPSGKRFSSSPNEAESTDSGVFSSWERWWITCSLARFSPRTFS